MKTSVMRLASCVFVRCTARPMRSGSRRHSPPQILEASNHVTASLATVVTLIYKLPANMCNKIHTWIDSEHRHQRNDKEISDGIMLSH